ncbi:MAG TPA: carboxypeptidase regulatory-like domain-containing protein, partial [Puia sp.]
MIKRLLLSAFSLLCVFFTFAQVTTSGITGTVKDTKGAFLAGATITAVHVPSGTKYITISKTGGVFNIPGMRAGGPYKVTIGYVGYADQTVDGLTLTLGDDYNLSIDLSEKAVDLSAVTVTGRRRIAREQSGVSTNINSYQMSTLPTISRSITDFTRITPQANGTGFAGRDSRMNNVTVDGANLNNNFGLSSDLLPGAGNPIPLDAFQEITVNLSPFDVKQSGFTGAGVNAITKSGTNTFHGSAYGAYRNQSYNGTNVAGNKLPSPAKTSNNLYGLTVGGPIIKNRLFFFVSGELENSKKPGVTYAPAGGSGNGIQSNVSIDSLSKLSSYLKSQYNFDPGAYDNFPVFDGKNHKLLGKIDFNISATHKLTVKYSDYKATNYFVISQSGGINGANGGAGVATKYVPRFGTQAMSFNNVNYSQEDKVKTASVELNSNFRGKFANQFIATYTKITTFKGHDGPTFPFVDIMGITPGDKVNYLSFGNEPFNANNNKVINDVVTVTDNFTYFAGRHTFTAGANYEYQKVGNMFMPGSQGYYIYNSLDDFMNNRAPALFSINYSEVKGEDAVYSANMKVGQIGVYLQDDYVVNPRIKVSVGLRVDVPIFPAAPLGNPMINAVSLYDKKGNLTHYDDSKWPTANPLFSPRASFRWDVKGDKSLIVRGGTGIFTGRVPFVFLTNQPSTSGMYTFGATVKAGLTGIDMNNFKFNPDPHAYNPFYNTSLNATYFPTTAGATAPGSIAVLDRKFKFHQVWRTDLAVDKKFGDGFTATAEALITKDVN